MSAHTPGPWSVFRSAETLAVDIGPKSNGRRPNVVDWTGFDSCGLPFEQRIANAQLIAAAPETAAERDRLLEALKELFADYKQLADSGDAGNWRLEETEAGAKALAAIAAVEGRQS